MDKTVSIGEVRELAAKAVAHPLLPRQAAAAIMGLIDLVEAQGQAIQELREAARPCPCEKVGGSGTEWQAPAGPLPTITDVFGVGVTGLPG